MNELDELLEQWPNNQARTVALLGVQRAFYENGAPHWEQEAVWAENRENVHAHMLDWRRMMRRVEPGRAARFAEHQALAEAALAERQRRKQGPPTGKGPHRSPQAPRQPKALNFAPAQPRPHNRPAMRPRYTAAQLRRDPQAYQASVQELDALLQRWPYKRNRILYLLTVHEALAQRDDPAADPPHLTGHEQAEREARSWLACRRLYSR
ncbi:hypothetical protein KLP40_20775 [Hymenobacter sp. NST-14]|uniref:hypothetical protein n=1 Tax=Hymenobacter piscis TaxID=2839984 RepID=UPI001C011B20|nr:hypothetical protein [Hymenobacter piscis]MBT9395613.1 hypothetical protein [Hymenobacter piscis]